MYIVRPSPLLRAVSYTFSLVLPIFLRVDTLCINPIEQFVLTVPVPYLERETDGALVDVDIDAGDGLRVLQTVALVLKDANTHYHVSEASFVFLCIQECKQVRRFLVK